MNGYVRFGIVAALAGALGACATGSEGKLDLGRALVAPGGYDFYDCPQLARQEKAFTDRERELSRLMQRARQGPAGGFVSSIAYEPEYAANTASLRELRRAQTEKNCTRSPAPATRQSGRAIR
jgi:hypothetical protein